MVEPCDRTADWTALESELDAWQAAGAAATFWWRDDDATFTGEALERLLALAPTVPLAIAVIPEAAEPALAQRVRTDGRLVVLQHGYAHRNHAPPTAKKAEYGAQRQDDEMMDEVVRGRSRLSELFDGGVRPIFVPPWNRIGDGLAVRLGELGFDAISTFGTAPERIRPKRINTHVDIIDWSGSRGFTGEPVALGAMVRHLAARRAGKARRTEATGLMTHHKDHDERAWKFLDRLFDLTTTHRASCWMDVDALLETTP